MFGNRFAFAIISAAWLHAGYALYQGRVVFIFVFIIPLPTILLLVMLKIIERNTRRR